MLLVKSVYEHTTQKEAESEGLNQNRHMVPNPLLKDLTKTAL